MAFFFFVAMQIDPLFLTKTAYELRINVIDMLIEAQSGHTAGPLGMAEVFSVLYFSGLVNINPQNKTAPDRDRVILSNGHIAPIRYAAMAKAGFFASEMLHTFRKLHSPLQGHPSVQDLPEIETSSGPLGQGISQAVGIAIGLRHEQSSSHVYCLISDGECQEGQTWEALVFANSKNLTNLTVVIDRNRIQIDGSTDEIVPGLEPLAQKLQAFGWETLSIDGNDVSDIIEALGQSKKKRNKPLVIIANTTPGKGVSFMEDDYLWHGKAPTKAEGQQAKQELTAALASL